MEAGLAKGLDSTFQTRILSETASIWVPHTVSSREPACCGGAHWSDDTFAGLLCNLLVASSSITTRSFYTTGSASMALSLYCCMLSGIAGPLS